MSLRDLARQAELATRAEREAAAVAEVKRQEDAKVEEVLRTCLKGASEGRDSVLCFGKEEEPWVARVLDAGFTISFSTEYTEPGYDSDLGHYGGDTHYYAAVSGWTTPGHSQEAPAKCHEAYVAAMIPIRKKVADGPFSQVRDLVVREAAKGRKEVLFKSPSPFGPDRITPVEMGVLVQMIRAEGLRVEDRQGDLKITGW